MMFIISFPILLWSFKLIPCVLVKFWRLWLFNYSFYFTLVFPTLNIMDWHVTRVITSISISRTYVQYFISIRWGNPKLSGFQCGFRVWSLMGVRVHGIILNYRLPNQYLSEFCLHTCYKLHILTPGASFSPFFLWRVREEFRCENTNIVFVRKRGSNIILGSFHDKTKFSSEKHFHVSKLKFFTHFNSKHISSNLKKKIIIELSMISINPLWLAFSFFIKTHENESILNWNMFLHDST